MAGQRDSAPAWPKYVLFAVLGLMALFVLWSNERFFLNPQAPEWAHYNQRAENWKPDNGPIEKDEMEIAESIPSRRFQRPWS